ncbi:MAG: DNA polymerase III subunit alpha [Candidatus Colwellbacteria bacterium CG10_big_fil_rev_8_21_14_0_10_41_28]|uniref:DNA polymerase III subunit alpha n=1 Tax=Candidatus Colwellbacteria bacterium CG10_big_fil_rev_8_21_14_0_10_41_28 TaxID=1974539 RepID=A0A2H0VHK4_9BACT|nr:MAG: DNA polymerase III subunit alpha [Candidatus Colwellbacteria bacterium CG10_big_fil_rev_8_21_14_0_10_41_28]
MSKFVHLHTHSHYSLLDGLSKVEQLVDRAKEYGMESLAITDHGNLYGSVEFYKKAKKAGIKPIIGLEAYVASRSRLQKDPALDATRYHLTLLVKNEVGYKNLVQLVTKSNLEGFYYKPRIDHELLEKHHEGLIALSGCFSGELSRAIEAKDMAKAKEVAEFYKKTFGDDYFIELQAQSEELHQGLLDISKELDIPMVATQDSHYIGKSDQPIHDVLLAIQTGNTVDDEDRFSFEDYDASFCNEEGMYAIFEKHNKILPKEVIKDSIEITKEIADRCSYDFDLKTIHLPKFDLPDGEKNAMDYLRKLVNEGIKQKYDSHDEKVIERATHELSVIEKTGFEDYFLIVADMVNWAKSRGIVVGPGRGSAAGSLVSYVLNITGVDPLQYDLLFERFLNPERNEMPDIDIDFADHRRGEVFGYLREKYGEGHVAQIITFGTMAARQAIRDAGRALGYTYSYVDQIAKMVPFNPNTSRPKNEIEAYIKQVPELENIYRTDKQAERLLDVASKLEGVVRHASVHACGTVVTEEPVTEWIALQRAPQDENTIITQIEFHAVEDLGLLKIDLLGLRNLTVIEETIRIVRELENEEVSVEKIPLDDKKTFDLLKTGETTGVFQFESSGMRRYMKEIQPTELEDLIALVALYRPGPMELIPSFINRKSGKEAVTYLHPELEPILKNTYGIGVYQEQMMRIATDLAGYTLPEADTLRKAIGKKIESLLNEQKEKLISGMIAHGIDERTAKQIWELFPPFARYGFNRSHAVSYALIGYWTAYLKAHYPVEYMTALLNNAGNDVDRISFFIGEAERMDIEVLPPDINQSVANFVPEGDNIRFGLAAIKNVGHAATERIVEDRMRNGPFEGLADMAIRMGGNGLNKKVLESLIKSGSLDTFKADRMTALENVDHILKASREGSKDNNQAGLFGGNHTFEIQLKPASRQATKSEILSWEKELLGLYVTEHPLKGFFEKNKDDSLRRIKEIMGPDKDGKSFRICGVVSRVQKIITKNGSSMVFAKIEDIDDSIEVLVFSDVLGQSQNLWQEGKALSVSGRISLKDGETKIICQRAEEIEI